MHLSQQTSSERCEPWQDHQKGTSLPFRNRKIHGIEQLLYCLRHAVSVCYMYLHSLLGKDTANPSLDVLQLIGGKGMGEIQKHG